MSNKIPVLRFVCEKVLENPFMCLSIIVPLLFLAATGKTVWPS